MELRLTIAKYSWWSHRDILQGSDVIQDSHAITLELSMIHNPTNVDRLTRIADPGTNKKCVVICKEKWRNATTNTTWLKTNRRTSERMLFYGMIQIVCNCSSVWLSKEMSFAIYQRANDSANGSLDYSLNMATEPPKTSRNVSERVIKCHMHFLVSRTIYTENHNCTTAPKQKLVMQYIIMLNARTWLCCQGALIFYRCWQ